MEYPDEIIYMMKMTRNIELINHLKLMKKKLRINCQINKNQEIFEKATVLNFKDSESSVSLTQIRPAFEIEGIDFKMVRQGYYCINSFSKDKDKAPILSVCGDGENSIFIAKGGSHLIHYDSIRRFKNLYEYSRSRIKLIQNLQVPDNGILIGFNNIYRVFA
jgi:hypothetical protein